MPHALDELHSRPLGTEIPRVVLVWLAAASLAAAVAIGIGAAFAWTLWLLPFVAAGAFLVPAYTLELGRGRFHTDLWFGLAWGAFPVLVAYLGAAETLRPEAFIVAAFALLTSLAQRSLSTQVRTVRRRVAAVTGTLYYRDGHEEPVEAETLARAPRPPCGPSRWRWSRSQWRSSGCGWPELGPRRSVRARTHTADCGFPPVFSSWTCHFQPSPPRAAAVTRDGRGSRELDAAVHSVVGVCPVQVPADMIGVAHSTHAGGE